MKIVIAGSRTLNKLAHVETAMGQAINKWIAEDQDNWKNYVGPEIVSGGAQGVDFLAELYAKKHTLQFTEFPADWTTHGKKAGFLRNAQMAEYGDNLVVIWDGMSKGTLHMINCMSKLNKPVFVYCPK